MPGVSQAQVTAARIAKHAPKSELKGASKKMAESMSSEQLHHFAATETKDLPEHKEPEHEKKAALSRYGFLQGYRLK